MSVRLLTGDCRDVLPTLEDGSFDACITDPPYDLTDIGRKFQGSGGSVDERTGRVRSESRRGGFMGKQWDGTGVAFDPATWQAVYRVLRPGAYLLAFGGTRTFHRMTVAIEDAGFEIKDCLCWLYGSGFPKHKSHLKPAWEPVIVAKKPGAGGLHIETCRIPHDEPIKTMQPQAHYSKFYGQGGRHQETTELKESGRWPANVCLDEAAAAILDDMTGERKLGGSPASDNNTDRGAPTLYEFAGGNVYKSGAHYADAGGPSRFFYVAKADRAERDKGLDGLPIRNVGVGHRATESGEYLDFIHPAPEGIGEWLRGWRLRAGLSLKDVARLFPSRSGGITGCVTNWEREYNRPTPEQWWTLKRALGFDDTYDAVMTEVRPVEYELFDDREPPRARNHHPTVKPLALMQWLVRLVAQPGQTVLDPFVGSGTTMVACDREGVNGVGIDREAEYIEIAKRRTTGDAPLFAEVTTA